MADDFERKTMDEATDKLNLYVKSLVKNKKNKQAEAFCEEKYAEIALTGFLKRMISAFIEKGGESGTAPSDTLEFIRDRLSGKTKVKAGSGYVRIDAGEGAALILKGDGTENYEVTVCVPEKKEHSNDFPNDPDTPDGKEEKTPLSFAPDKLGAFCAAAEYVFDNAHEFKEWAKIKCSRLWEMYKYLDYPKKDVYDKVPVYWWSDWLENASEKDLSDIEFVKKLVIRRGECFSAAPAAVRADRSTALKAIRDFSYAINFASEELQNDRGFVLQAIEQRSDVFQYLKDKFKDDKKVALAAVGRSGWNLEYVSKRLKNDTDLVDLAMAEDVYFFRFASPEIRDNTEYVKAAVRERGELLSVLSDRMKSDRNVVLSAVSENGEALEYALDEYKNDREIVMAAVTNKGAALEYASKKLRGDKQIVLAAINNDADALSYASGKLRDDKETALMAISKDGKAYYDVSKRLKRDTEVIKAAVNSSGQKIFDAIPKDIKAGVDFILFMLETIKERLPDMDDYGEFADGTSEYYNVFEDSEDAFCDVVEQMPFEELKKDGALVDKICKLAVEIDDSYYDKGTYPYEYSHTRLPDRLKEYFEKNNVPYSDVIDKSIENREAKKYHPKEYGDDIPFEEKAFLRAADYYEWLAEKMRGEDGDEAFARYLNGGFVYYVMEDFVKNLAANWEGLFHDSELWRDDEYEVDLDKVYEEIAERLSSKMTVRRTAYDYYYSENVKVFVNDNVRFELVREVPLRILELWVNDYDTDVESGFWVAPDRLDVFCDMAEYVQNNYETYEKRARAHADKMLKEN